MMNKNMRIAKELIKLAKDLMDVNVSVTNDGKSDYSLNYDDSGEILDRAEKAGKKYILYKQQGDLWRIKACKNFSDVKKGDLGGLIGSENNLSHEGDCWVYGSAMVHDNAQVYDNALVYDKAEVYGNARVYGRAMVSGKAEVYGDAKVFGNAEIFDAALVDGNAMVYGNARVFGDAVIYGKAKVDYEVFQGDVTR